MSGIELFIKPLHTIKEFVIGEDQEAVNVKDNFDKAFLMTKRFLDQRVVLIAFEKDTYLHTLQMVGELRQEIKVKLGYHPLRKFHPYSDSLLLFAGK